MPLVPAAIVIYTCSKRGTPYQELPGMSADGSATTIPRERLGISIRCLMCSRSTSVSRIESSTMDAPEAAHAGLAIAEDFSDRVDGVIATAAGDRVWLMNTKLDKWFVLKALIAPDLRIVDLPHSSSLRPEYPELTFAWRQAIRAAQQTPEGRARIALAITIGQEPDWVNPTDAESGSERCSCASVQYVPDCSRWCRAPAE